jgi:hypothetical protein
MERERQALAGDGGAVLYGESEALGGATEVEVGVTPGVKLRASSQGLSCADVPCALAGMVDNDDGEAVSALHVAQVSE